MKMKTVMKSKSRKKKFNKPKLIIGNIMIGRSSRSKSLKSRINRRIWELLIYYAPLFKIRKSCRVHLTWQTNPSNYAQLYCQEVILQSKMNSCAICNKTLRIRLLKTWLYLLNFQLKKFVHAQDQIRRIKAHLLAKAPPLQLIIMITISLNMAP